MYGSEIRQSNPTRLAHILEFTQSERPWQPDELGAVLRHQLAAPLEFDQASVGERFLTIGDLLNHPSPPVALLQQLKRFAKAHAVDPNHLIPHEIAAVLYYAAICAARLRCGEGITALDVESLELGISQLLACSWLEDSIRSLLTLGLAQLKKESAVH
jgi:hypothetical protein